jgi:hypothetical protein
MRELRDLEIEQVSGAGKTCERDPGNNGWGNGGDDGINSPKVEDGFKVDGDSEGAFGAKGGGRTKCAR